MNRNLLIAFLVCVGATLLVRSATAKPGFVAKPPVVVPIQTPIIVPVGTVIITGDAPPVSDN